MPSTGVQVDVCGVTCSTGSPTADNAVWIVTEISGWDSPEQRTGQIAPTGRHGAAPLGSLYGGRTLTVSGVVFADTDADAWASYYRLTGSMPALNQSGELVVYESPAKLLKVEQVAPPRVSAPVNGFVEFQLSLLAPFPFKTSTTATTTALAAAATASLTNSGTAAAYPVVTTTSSGTVDLVIGGRHFTTGAVASGTVIDMWARTIRTSSGVDVSPWPKVPATEWLAVPPGASSVEQAGTAGLSIVTYHTYA